MSPHAILFLLLFAVASLSSAADISTMSVTYRSGEEEVSAYLAMPEGRGPFPSIILVHEWWGLNDWIRGNADDFARRGYAALAVDLYRGKSTASAEEAHELMRGLPEGRAARDLKAAAAYLRSRADVQREKIGAIGWCMGGGYALMAAMNVKGLAGAVVCYGRLVSEPAEIKSIGAPILGIFGGEDRGIPVESVKAFEKSAAKAGKKVTMEVYPSAGHAFMNPGNKGYRPEEAADAWRKIHAFFAARLGGSQDPP